MFSFSQDEEIKKEKPKKKNAAETKAAFFNPSQLPKCVWAKIASELNAKEYYHFRLTCKFFNSVNEKLSDEQRKKIFHNDSAAISILSEGSKPTIYCYGNAESHYFKLFSNFLANPKLAESEVFYLSSEGKDTSHQINDKDIQFNYQPIDGLGFGHLESLIFISKFSNGTIKNGKHLVIIVNDGLQGDVNDRLKCIRNYLNENYPIIIISPSDPSHVLPAEKEKNVERENFQGMKNVFEIKHAFRSIDDMRAVFHNILYCFAEQTYLQKRMEIKSEIRTENTNKKCILF